MNEHFREAIEALHPSLEKLIAMAPVAVPGLMSPMPEQGVYLFTEGARPLYVGRSNRLRQRLQQHSRPSSGHDSAPFAFLLAREATGITSPTYQVQGSRGDLSKQAQFGAAFTTAKQRIRSMSIRFVEEPDQLRQALLEMYVAIALETPYNTWGTH